MTAGEKIGRAIGIVLLVSWKALYFAVLTVLLVVQFMVMLALSPFVRWRWVLR